MPIVSQVSDVENDAIVGHEALLTLAAVHPGVYQNYGFYFLDCWTPYQASPATPPPMTLSQGGDLKLLVAR